MSNEVKLLIQISIILLQFYVGAVAFMFPERLHLGHYIVILFVSIPILVGLVRKKLK